MFIYNSVSKLTIDGPSYKLWLRIFKDLLIRAIVLGYVNSTKVPQNENDEAWYSMDAKIKSWLYNTCDADLLQIITTVISTSKNLWENIGVFFLSKMSRMLQLQASFRNN